MTVVEIYLILKELDIVDEFIEYLEKKKDTNHN